MSGLEQTACYSATVGSSGACTQLGGQWSSPYDSMDATRCVWSDAPTEALCASLHGSSGAVFAACEQATTQAACSSAPDNAALGWAADWLQCQWNQWAQCESDAACTAHGQCDDQEFYQCNYAEQPQVCTSSACVFAWTVAAVSGQRNPCAAGQQQGTLGCNDFAYASAADCRAAGGRWLTLAQNATQCAAHASVCQPAGSAGAGGAGGGNSWQWTHQGAQQCAECGGALGPAFTWSYGRVLPSSILPTQWVARNWTRVNQYQQTLDQGLLQNEINAAVAALQARAQINLMVQTYGALVPLFTVVSCDCLDTADNVGVDCFADVATAVQAEQCLLDPTQNSTCGGLTVPSTSGNTTGQLLVINNILTGLTIARLLGGFALQSGGFAPRDAPGFDFEAADEEEMDLQGSAISMRLASRAAETDEDGGSRGQAPLPLYVTGNSAAYSIVRNALGYVIGEVVTNGVDFQWSGPPSDAVSLCIAQVQAYTPNYADYPVFDFCIGTTNGTGFPVPGPPLGTTASHVCTFAGCSICGYVPASTTQHTYFGILRVAAYNTTTRNVGLQQRPPSRVVVSAAPRGTLPARAPLWVLVLLLLSTPSLALLSLAIHW